jgi:DNA modification methylase
MTAAYPIRNRTVIGDAAVVLATLPDQCVDMVLTSPPYFRLRNYQIDGQLGAAAVAQITASGTYSIPTAYVWWAAF